MEKINPKIITENKTIYHYNLKETL